MLSHQFERHTLAVEARCTSVQSFNQAEDVRRYIVLVTHSKERAYNCVQCNKTFGVAGSLKTRMSEEPHLLRML